MSFDELTRWIVNNDFHENDEIYSLFDGLIVPEMDEDSTTNETADSINGHIPNGVASDTVVNGVH
jgi:hypothetical protein